MPSVDQIYETLKTGRRPTYNEEVHCKLILKTMMKEGRITAFAAEAMVHEDTFYRWVREHELFKECYLIGKVFARESWELEGERLRDREMPIGVVDYAFEHWKMMGWSRFGISKNSRIKLQLKANDTPDKHYAQLLEQAANGDFTASEIKQLMEAINVGLNTHQVFALQKEIDQLKSDLATMQANTDAHNSGTNKGIAQKDQGSLANSLCEP